jgi:hypothetical protein
LKGKYKTLDRAFGLVSRPGNPGGNTSYKEAARSADQRGLTDAQWIAEQPPRVSGRDEATSRENRKRGREAYQRDDVVKMTNEFMDKLLQDMENSRKSRIDAVQRYNKKHGIKPMS